VQFASFADPSARRTKSLQDADAKQCAAAVQRALEGVVLLEAFPKSVVDVHILIVEGQGGENTQCPSTRWIYVSLLLDVNAVVTSNASLNGARPHGLAGETSAAITCTSAALAHAGIPMRDLVMGASVVSASPNACAASLRAPACVRYSARGHEP
jgi:ribonuclease PH